ncbi:hypothetical protein K491DRAFT_311379 [Lophiostoma macrostomum CBS 122681]|uniref:Uncharacterized protein n=1 Tax=Lophiostoma macrostomum CBS 122681 TaxID=1314788 RepID=A0A6A6TFN8_9PLEO|nr:hypothetical protein K491DRAFT_311379 [Lophiostoma macrostomum CBS 122681]
MSQQQHSPGVPDSAHFIIYTARTTFSIERRFYYLDSGTSITPTQNTNSLIVQSIGTISKSPSESQRKHLRYNALVLQQASKRGHLVRESVRSALRAKSSARESEGLVYLIQVIPY